MRKRLFSLLLVLAMLLSLGASAFATTTPETTTITGAVGYSIEANSTRVTTTTDQGSWRMTHNGKTVTGKVQPSLEQTMFTVDGITIKLKNPAGGTSGNNNRETDVIISGKPKVAGEYSFVLYGANSQTEKATFTVNVVAANKVVKPVFDKSAISANLTKLADLELKISDDLSTDKGIAIVLTDASTILPITWSIKNLPAGLSADVANNTSGTLTLFGTPTETANAQEVTVTATNVKGSTDYKFKINVGYEDDLKWNLNSNDGEDAPKDNGTHEIAERFDGAYYVGQNIQSEGPYTYEYIIDSSDWSVTASGDDSATWVSGTEYVISADPGPVTWTFKNLPSGLKATVSDDSRYVTLSGKFVAKDTSAFNYDETSADYVILKNPLVITATNAGIDEGNTKTLTRTIFMKVYNTPAFKTTSLAGLTVGKAYKQKIEVTNPVEDFHVYIKEKAVDDSTSPDVWQELTSDAALTVVDGEVTGYNLKTQNDIDNDVEGTAGKLYWDPKTQQIMGTLKKIPAGNAINVKVLASNAKQATATKQYIVLEKNIAVTGEAPTIAKDSDSTLDLVYDFTGAASANDVTSIKFKVSKGTYPVTLKATIDANTAKTFIGTQKLVEIPNAIESADANAAKFGFAFMSTLSADPSATDDTAVNGTDGYSVILDDEDGTATLVLAGSSDITAQAYKGLKLTVTAYNDQTGAKVGKATTFNINLNKDNSPAFYGPKFDSTNDGYMDTTDTDYANFTDADNKITAASKTYKVTMGSGSFDAYFTVNGNLPLKLTSPTKTMTDNGLTLIVKEVTVSDDAGVGDKTIPAVEIKGEPTAEKDSKFKLTATNPLLGKTVNLNLVISPQKPSDVATKKPTIGSASNLDLVDYAGSGYVDGKDNRCEIKITDGLPLITTSGGNLDGLRVYVDAATAKLYGLGNKETDLLDSTNGDTTNGAPLGLTFSLANSDSLADGDDGYVVDMIVISLDTSVLDATADGIASYKGLPIIVEAKNYVTEQDTKKTPVTKTFKLNVNANNTLKMMGPKVNANGDADSSDIKVIDGTSVTYNAYFGTTYTDTDFPLTLTGGAPIEVTSPKTGTKVNGIEITIDTDNMATSGDIPITFSGTLAEKKDTTFTIAANNKYSGNKISFKLTLKANNPAGLAKEKPVIGSMTETTLKDGVGMTDEEVVPSTSIYITKGLPLKKTETSTSDYDGLNVYIDASAAKTYGLNASGKAAYLITNGVADDNVAAKLGLTAGISTQVINNVSTDVISISFDRTNATYQGYKALPITVEASNYVTEQVKGKKPVTKSFKLNVNPDHVPSVWSGDVELSKDLTVTAWLNETLDSAAAAITVTASGDKEFKLTAPAKTTTTNGITATVNTTNKTVAFSGTPLKKTKTKFPVTVENPQTKKKITRNIIFNVIDKPLEGEEEDFDEALGININANDTADMVVGATSNNNPVISFDVTGHPETIYAEIEAGTAKSIFKQSKAILLTPAAGLASGDTATAVSDTKKTGLVFDKVLTGNFITGATLSWAVSEDAAVTSLSDYAVTTAYKSAKLNVVLTRSGETVKKTFTFSMNKDDEPVWYFASVEADGTLSDDKGTQAEEDVVIATTAGEPIDEAKSYIPLWADNTDVKSVTLGQGDSPDQTVVAQKLTYIVDLRVPYTITPASTKATNGLTVNAEALSTQPDGLPGKGLERVKITISGKPTKNKDTTSKIPMEIAYGNGKKAKHTVTISAFAKPENFDNHASFGSTKAKEYEVGKKVDIKPKLTINKNITPAYYITSEDKAKLDAAVLTFNPETAAITADAGKTVPTVTSDDAGNLLYDKSQVVTVYGFFNGTYPESADKTTGLIADGAEDAVIASADVKLEVGIKIKPITPKIKTSKIIYKRNPDADSNIDDYNKTQIIEVSNIADTDLKSGDDGENPRAVLTYAATTALSNMGLSLVSFDNDGTEAWTVSGDSSSLTSKKATNIPVTVYNYSNSGATNKIFATKNISIAIVDPKPVVSGDATIEAATASTTAAVTKTATYTEKYYSGKETTLKWKVSTSEAVSGVTAKIVQNSKNPETATVTFTAKKKLANGGTAKFNITVTNTVTKETSDPFEVSWTVTGTEDTQALPEDSTALPEDTTALPEDTTALPDEDVESLLPKDRMLGEGDVKLGNERTADTITDEELRQIEAILGEGYEIAAILPEVTVTADGQYDLIIDLNDKASGDVEEIALESEEGTTEETAATEKKLAGKELVWFAFPRDVEPSEDDEIVDFYDMEGHDTKVIPESNVFVVSPWFDKEVVYAPVIAVKSDNGVTEQELAGVDSADKVVEIKTTDPKVEIITEDSADENVEELEEETEVELELE